MVAPHGPSAAASHEGEGGEGATATTVLSNQVQDQQQQRQEQERRQYSNDIGNSNIYSASTNSTAGAARSSIGSSLTTSSGGSGGSDGDTYAGGGWTTQPESVEVPSPTILTLSNNPDGGAQQAAAAIGRGGQEGHESQSYRQGLRQPLAERQGYHRHHGGGIINQQSSTNRDNRHQDGDGGTAGALGSYNESLDEAARTGLPGQQQQIERRRAVAAAVAAAISGPGRGVTGGEERDGKGVIETWRLGLQVGAELDVKDTVDLWCEATVLGVDREAERVLIHYTYWAPRVCMCVPSFACCAFSFEIFRTVL